MANGSTAKVRGKEENQLEMEFTCPFLARIPDLSCHLFINTRNGIFVFEDAFLDVDSWMGKALMS